MKTLTVTVSYPNGTVLEILHVLVPDTARNIVICGTPADQLPSVHSILETEDGECAEIYLPRTKETAAA